MLSFSPYAANGTPIRVLSLRIPSLKRKLKRLVVLHFVSKHSTLEDLQRYCRKSSPIYYDYRSHGRTIRQTEQVSYKKRNNDKPKFVQNVSPKINRLRLCPHFLHTRQTELRFLCSFPLKIPSLRQKSTRLVVVHLVSKHGNLEDLQRYCRKQNQAY